MARLEEFDDVQLDVEFTQAGTRSNLTSKENIAISFGKIAKWYEALVPTGGSSGQFLGFNSSGTAKWVSNPNVDEKVKAIKLAQSTADASYYPTLVAGEGTAGVNIFDSAKINHTKGTTSAVGNTRLILGNATNEGTANNEEGLLRIYSPGTKYHTLKGAKITTDNVEHTLPTIGGTILNTGTTSFTQTLSSGTKIGTIKINGTSSDIYAPTDTDTKVTDTVGTANTYYPAGGTSTSTATGTQVFDTSFKFIGTTGTTSAVGKAQLVLGNATASGTANNKQGSIVVYGSTAYAHTIQGAPTAARTLTLPDKAGTFALTSDIPSVPTVNDAALTLKGAGTTVTTFTANASSAKSLDIVAGSNVTVTADATNAKISIASSHPTITKSTDTTSTASPAHGGTFTVVDSITREANGHVTKINTKTVTLPADSNTDTKVTQSATTTTNYRPILFGAKNSTDVSTLADTITDQAYTSTKMFAKPETGILYASGFSTSGYTNGTGAQLAQYGLYLKSYKSASLPAGGDYSYSRYALRVYDGKSTDNAGMLLTIDGGGLTIVGAGESASSLAALISDDQRDSNTSRTRLNVGGTLNTSFSGSVEQLILSSDNNIYFLTKCNTIADRKPVVLDTNSYFYPGTTKTGSIGTSSYMWNSVYAATIYENGTSLASKYAAIGHTHTTTIAADSGTNQLTLAASTKYKLTAGETNFIFTTPPNTTYSAGSGLSLSGTTINHSNSVTARTNYDARYIKYDAQGHVTGASYWTATATGTDGEAGWIKIATIVHTKTYDNTPIMLFVSQRGDIITYRIHIQWTNSSTTDPPLGKFHLVSDENTNAEAYIIKSATSTWDLYIKKIDSYEAVGMHLYVGKYFSDHMTWTWQNVQTAASAITGGTAATKMNYYNTKTSRTANTVLAAPNGSDGVATFRKLVAADIPSLNYSKVSISRNLTSGTKVGTITIDGTSTDLYCQTNTNTDTLVSQTFATADKNRPLLMSYYDTGVQTTTAQIVHRNDALYFNPSSGILRSPRLYLQTPDMPITINLHTLQPTAGKNVDVLSVKYKNTDGTATHTVFPIGILGNDATGSGATNNSGVRLGSTNGTTIVGAGESSTTFAAAQAKYNDENLYFVADGAVYMYTNCSNDSTTVTGPWRVGGFTTGTSAITSGRVMITDGTTGGFKASDYTIAKSVPSDAVFTDTVTTVTTSGSGNAVTSITASNGALTVTKGSTFSLSTHTHNYAGSSSAGGAANSANVLNYNNSVTATTSGLQYTHGSMTIGTADGNAKEGSNDSYKLWSYPTGGTVTNSTSANIQNLRLYWSSTYFRDIFISPNNQDIYHRAVYNGSAKPWRVILDSFNLEQYNIHNDTVSKTFDLTSENTMGPIERTIDLFNRSNKLALIESNKISIEYSTDSGSNWTAYGLTADQNADLFNGSTFRAIYIGPNSTAERTTSMQTRITITNDNRDVIVDQIFLMGSTSYHTVSVDIQVAYGNATSTFSNWKTGIEVGPWKYQTMINLGTKRFGAGTTASYVNKIRFILKYTQIDSNHKTDKSAVKGISGFGGCYWTGAVPNYLALNNHLYSWDNSKNATFPANIVATGFKGTVYHNATNPTSESNYPVSFGASSSDFTSRYSNIGVNDGISYRTAEGTTSSNGFGVLCLGNSIASGTAGNKYGGIRFYSSARTYYTQITPTTLTATRQLSLPNKGGTIAVTSDIPTVSGVYLPLAGGTMTGDITFATISGDTYPISSKGIKWGGGTDAIEMYYNLRASDAGELIINMRDDTNVRTSFAYNGTVKSYIDTSGNFSGNAATSSSWATARTLTLSGQLTGSVSVKGDANMTLSGWLKKSLIYDETSDFASYAWHKFAEKTITNANEDQTITFIVSKTWGNVPKCSGILTAHIRTGSTKVYESSQFYWQLANSEIDPEDFVFVYTNTADTSCKVELWYKQTVRYDGWIFTVLKEHSRTSNNNVWTLYTSAGHGSASHTTGTNSYTSSITDIKNNTSGTSSNVTGTVAIANGGTGATTRLSALKALTNENVGTNAQYFLTITQDWAKGGFTSVANVKTVLGLGSAAYKASSDFAVSQTLANDTNLNNITTPGFYNCGGTNSVTNKPSNVDAFGLIVIHDASGQWYTQILYPNNASPLIYVRNYNGSAWSGWNSIAIGSFLPLSGGTMTGTLTAKASQTTDAYSGALNMNNSNIYGVNAIYTADASDTAAEGIHFYRDATHVDTLWMNGGSLLFVPNRELGVSTTVANSQKVARFTANPTSGQVVITDGTAGGVKSSGYTIAKSVPSNAVFTDHITTATSSGSGNAVTAISADANGALTVTKGSTFSLSTHTHNYAGSSSAGGPATNVAIARVTKDSKVFPGANKVVFEEYTNGTTYNLPSNHFYHIMSAQGNDAKYGTQLALGMTTTAAYYRSYNNQTWSDWKSIINSNTYDRNRYNGNIKAGSSALVAANIIVGKDGVYNHLKSGGAFDITYPILYLNGAVNADGTTTNTYDTINFTITTTQSLTLAAYRPVYIKGTLNGTVFTPYNTTPLVQIIPTYDTYDYIYLGQATSSTTVYLQERHPIYSYRNGRVQEITPCASMAVTSDGFVAPMIKKLYDNSATSTNYITISDINIDDYEFFIICVTDAPKTDWVSAATQWIPAREGNHHFMINNGAAPNQGGGYIHCTDGSVFISKTGTNKKDLQFTLCRPAEAISTNGSSVTTDNFPNTRIMRVYGVKAF